MNPMIAKFLEQIHLTEQVPAWLCLNVGIFAYLLRIWQTAGKH